MSRCFPFPPPGYEKKPRTTEPVPVVDLLKKEKHKSKKDKKEKKDREKREGKERKHKDKNKEKHGEKDKQEKDREKKKDKDREKKKDKEREKKDKEKSKDKGGPSTEKTPEHQPGSTHEPKNVERQKTDDHNNINKKFVDELQQRIRNEVAGDRMVEHISRTPKLEGKFDSTILQKRPFSAIAQHPIKHDGSILPKRMHNEIAFKKNGNTSTMPEGKVTGNSLVHNINVELDVRSHIEDQKDAHKKPEQKGKTADSVNSGKVELVMDKKIEKQDKATDPVNIGKIGNNAVKKTEKKDKATDHSSVEKFGRDKDKEKKEKKEKKKDRKDKERTKDGKDRDKKKNKDGKDRHKNKEKKEKDKVKDKKHKENKQNADAAATELHILNNLVTNETEKQHPNKIVPSDHTENQHKFDGNLKRKVMNGFQHETLPNKLPKVVPSSLLPLENGRKPHLPSSSLQYQSDKQAISNSIKLPSPSHITSNSIRLPSPPHITSNSIKLPSPSHITSNSIKLPSPSHGKDQKLNGTVHLPTAIVPSSAVVNAAAEIDHVTQRPAQPGPSKVSPNAASRDAAENFDGSKRPFQSLPPRISSSSVVSDAAEINEASQRPPKSLTSRASLNAVIRDVAGANENSLKLPKPLPTKASQNAKVRDAGEIGEVSQRPPHPDEKYLAAVLHVPKLDEWPETDDQEWLFKNGDVLQKKPTHKAEVDDEPQVWSKAQRIESSDVLALPYVIPY